MRFMVTPGNCADNDIETVTALSNGLMGKMFGDRGYISQELFEQLIANKLHLVTSIRKNMKQRLLLENDKKMLKKRGAIESTIDILKNYFHMVHTRHRNITNFCVNIVASLIAYFFKPSKLSPKGTFAITPALSF